MTMISAHRAGVGADIGRENTKQAIVDAAELDCEFVEFDVQRLGDGTFVLSHGDQVRVAGKDFRLSDVIIDGIPGYTFLTYEETLTILRGRAKAHIDFKFSSPPGTPWRDSWEVEAAEIAASILGEDFILTTMEDESVRMLREWTDATGSSVLVGLSLGRSVRLPFWRAPLMWCSELFPGKRFRECRANLVVAHGKLARLSLAAFARTHRLPLLVWTVDDEGEMDYWLGRAWLLTTNYPRKAIELRGTRQA